MNDGAPSRKRLAFDKDAPNQNVLSKKRRVFNSEVVRESNVAVPADPPSRLSSKVEFVPPDTLSHPQDLQ